MYLVTTRQSGKVSTVTASINGRVYCYSGNSISQDQLVRLHNQLQVEQTLEQLEGNLLLASELLEKQDGIWNEIVRQDDSFEFLGKWIKSKW